MSVRYDTNQLSTVEAIAKLNGIKISFCILKQYIQQKLSIFLAEPHHQLILQRSVFNKTHTQGKKTIKYDYFEETNKCFTEKQCPLPNRPRRNWVGIYYGFPVHPTRWPSIAAKCLHFYSLRQFSRFLRVEVGVCKGRNLL